MKTLLSAIKEGEYGRVSELRNDEPMKLRLYELGITNGCVIKCVLSAPGGEPKAYLVRDSIYALRREDAGKIIITTD